MYAREGSFQVARAESFEYCDRRCIRNLYVNSFNLRICDVYMSRISRTDNLKSLSLSHLVPIRRALPIFIDIHLSESTD